MTKSLQEIQQETRKLIIKACCEVIGNKFEGMK